MYDLNRFIHAQKISYDNALLELKQGQKRSHWMWYIFPQLKGLGSSETATYYGIENIEEARAFMADEYLQNNLLQICQVLIDSPEHDATKMFGFPDNMKLRSSMTLFATACPEYKIFQQVIDKFFEGQMDAKSLELI